MNLEDKSISLFIVVIELDIVYWIIYNMFVLKLCPNCNNIAKGKHTLLSGSIYLAAIEFLAVVIILITGQVFGSKIVGLFFGIFFLLAGIKNLIEYYKGGNICLKCSHKSMIPLDTPDAIKLIKEKDLTIPEESSQQSKSSTQSN